MTARACAANPFLPENRHRTVAEVDLDAALVQAGRAPLTRTEHRQYRDLVATHGEEKARRMIFGAAA